MKNLKAIMFAGLLLLAGSAISANAQEGMMMMERMNPKNPTVAIIRADWCSACNTSPEMLSDSRLELSFGYGFQREPGARSDRSQTVALRMAASTAGASCSPMKPARRWCSRPISIHAVLYVDAAGSSRLTLNVDHDPLVAWASSTYRTSAAVAGNTISANAAITHPEMNMQWGTGSHGNSVQHAQPGAVCVRM